MTAVLTNSNQLALTWPYIATNCEYDVHQAYTPHFAMTAGSKIGYLENGDVSTVTPAETTDVYYQLQAHNCAATATADSNQVGQFSFAILPGS